MDEECSILERKVIARLLTSRLESVMRALAKEDLELN